MDLSDLGVGVARGPQGATGGERRKESNKLPQKFVLYSWIPRGKREGQVAPAHAVCHGWVEFSSVSAYDSAHHPCIAEQTRFMDEPDLQNLVQWEVRNRAALETPLQLSQACARSWKSVCILETQDETATLRKACGLGDSAKVRAFRVPLEHGRQFFRKSWSLLLSQRQHAQQAGVPVLAVCPATPTGPAAPPTPPAPDAHPQPPASPARPQRQQMDAYPAETVLDALRLRSVVSSEKVCLRWVLGVAARFLGPSAKDAVPTADVPGRELLRQASLRLNWIDMHFQRVLLQSHTAHRHLLADASCIAGFDFFIIQEDRRLWPAKWDIDQKLRDPDNHILEMRHLPTTTLGLGAAATANKISNVMHASRLESGERPMWLKWCSEVLSWTSDQGVEGSIADSPRLDETTSGNDWAAVIEAVRSNAECVQHDAVRGAYLFPNALGINDSLHIFFNALEHAVRSLGTWRQMERVLRAVALFLGSRGHRRRFVAFCLPRRTAPAVKRAFERWRHGTSFSWKWQYLRGFLERLLVLLPYLQEHFDVALMTVGSNAGDEGEASQVNSAIVSDVHKVLKEPRLRLSCTVLWSVALAVEQETSWQERCWCHEKDFAGPGDVREKTKRYREKSAGCCWKGRRGAELAAGHAETHFTNIMNATSPEFRRLMAEVTPEQRADLLALDLELKGKIVAELRAKLSPWKCLPLRLLGIYVHKQGGSVADARRCASECASAGGSMCYGFDMLQSGLRFHELCCV